MIKNLGTIDRLLRLVLGIVVIIYGLMTSTLIAIIVGTILILTSVFSFCPLYRSIKLSTYKKTDSESEKD